MSVCRKFFSREHEATSIQLPRVHTEGFHGFNREDGEFAGAVDVSALGRGPWPFFPFVPTLGLSLAFGNYAFGYDIKDGLGATNSRSEVGDAHGNQKGSYTLADIDGRARRVDYVA
ncbi:hypothetical protein AVEN_154624-1, partial [Araneus ventricosus]